MQGLNRPHSFAPHGPGLFRLACAIVVTLGLLNGHAGAQETAASTQPPDLTEPLTDPANDWRHRTLFTGRELTIYGQISQAILGYSDGAVRKTYAPVDNSNSSTRIGFVYDFRPLGDFNAVGRAEFGLAPRPSGKVSLRDPDGGDFEFDGSNIRKLELIIDTPRIGTFSIGQGSMATDGIAEIDLSRTSVAAYSNVGATAGGQYLRRANGTLGRLTIGNVFDNFDGDRVTGENSDGSRKLRVRYDTRERWGMKLSVAYGVPASDGKGNRYTDAALRYSTTRASLKLSAGLGYSYKAGNEIMAGSLSVIDAGTGLGFSMSAGHSSSTGIYGYAKASLTRRIWEAGDTSVSLDYYRGSDLTIAGSKSSSFGFAAVQQLRQKNTEIYFLARRHKYSETTVAYQPGDALFAGVRWSF